MEAKRQIIVLLVFSSLLIILSSCYKDLDLEKYRPEPKPVLNSAISPDTIVMASISRTVFYTDTNLESASIEDADVELYVNGEFKEKMTWQENNDEHDHDECDNHDHENNYLKSTGIYISTYKPITGDIIKIKAETDLGTIWAEDVVPAKINIEKIKISHITINDAGSTIVTPGGGTQQAQKYQIKYEITFQDDSQTDNYYCIRIENTHGNQPLGIIDYSHDPVFIAQQSIVDGTLNEKRIEGQGGRTFTDEIFNGKKYTLTITETEAIYMYEWGEVLNRRILLYSLSESYYNYLTQLLNVDENKLSYQLTDFGLAEPLPIYTNIHGGVGILGTVQTDIQIINLRDILPDYWEY